jgi:hypothetical protein
MVFIKIIKSRRMKWARHVAHVGEKNNVHNIWLKSLKGTDRLKDRAYLGG